MLNIINVQLCIKNKMVFWMPLILKKKRKSMSTDEIEPRHKKYHVWNSQRFNVLSYPALTLFNVNIDHYNKNQFPKCFFAKFDSRAEVPLKKSIVHVIYSVEQNLSKYIRLFKDMRVLMDIEAKNHAEIYHILWKCFSEL